MHDPFKNANSFRALISEMLKVTVQKTVDGKPIGEPHVVSLEDDDGDELEWYLDKYGRADWKRTEKYLEKGKKEYTKKDPNKLERGDPFEGMGREERERAIKQIDDVIQNVAPDGMASQLKQVILPWTQVGFDALRRILIAERRTGKQFPFFVSGDAVKIGAHLRFPTEPSKAVIDYLIAAKTRVGLSDTGKGELLLALMTGGIPPTGKDATGDLIINGRVWEVKDARDASASRIGDKHSNEIIGKINRWNLARGVNPETYIEKIKTNKNIPHEDQGTLNAMLHDAMEKSVAGVIAVEDDGYHVTSIRNLEFYNINKSGRVHFTVRADAVHRDEYEQKKADIEAAEDIPDTLGEEP